MFGNAVGHRMMALARRPIADRAGWIGRAAVAALIATAAPTQAQVVCTNNGIDRSCVNTGGSTIALRAQTATGGNASGNNSGTITGITPDNAGRQESILVFTQFGGNATAINSGSLPNSGFSVTTENLTPGANGDASGTNTATGTVATFFQVETGFQNAGTGGNATGINAGTVGQFFQVDTLTGGAASGINSGNVAQYFQVISAAGGDVTGNNSGTVGQNFLVSAAAGGNASGTNSGSVATSFQVNTGNGFTGNVSGTNTSTGTVGTDFQVITAIGEVNATNAGHVGGDFIAREGNFGFVHTVTATNTGGVVGSFLVLNASGGDTIVNSSGSVGGNFTVQGPSGGNVNVTNSGNVGGIFNVTITGGLTGTITAQNSGTVGGPLFQANNFVGSTTAANSGTVMGNFRIRAGAGNLIGSNTGTVNGAVTLSDSGGTINFTNSGTINGALGTAIQFTGGTNNTLTLLQGSSITGNILGAGGTLDFAVGPGTFTYGAASGFSGFNQVNVNSGRVILDGANSATNILVNGGSLQVGDASNPGATLTGAVTVIGGALSGHGTVIGNVIMGNGTTLAPGGSVGTLTIQGNLVLATATSYMVDVSSVAGSSTAVSGTATLGGTVGVFSSTNSFRFNSPYTILTSAGLGGTQFNGLTTPAGMMGALSYSGGNVQLTLTSALAQFAAANGHKLTVANGLDAAFNANGGAGPLGAIFNGDIERNLTQASGELGTGSQQATFNAMNLFVGVMTDPFNPGRGAGGSATGVTGFAGEHDGADAYAANGVPRTGATGDAYAMITKAVPPAAIVEPRWSLWAAGFGGSQTTNGNAALGANNAGSSIYGTAVGADYRFSPSTLAGFALAGGGTNFNVTNGGLGHSDLFQAGAYLHHTMDAAYISAALAYGWQDITTNRTVTIAGVDQLQARFNANAFSGRLESGYRFVAPWSGGFGFTPYAAGQFTTFALPSYAEGAVVGTNTFALAYGAKDVTDTRSELGFRTDKALALTNGVLTLRSRFAWAHDFDPDRSVAATFQALPAASFVVNGAAQARESALTTASAEMKWMNGWSAAATFEGEFSNVTRSYAGKGVVRYQW